MHHRQYKRKTGGGNQKKKRLSESKMYSSAHWYGYVKSFEIYHFYLFSQESTCTMSHHSACHFYTVKRWLKCYEILFWIFSFTPLWKFKFHFIGNYLKKVLTNKQTGGILGRQQALTPLSKWKWVPWAQLHHHSAQTKYWSERFCTGSRNKTCNYVYVCIYAYIQT